MAGKISLVIGGIRSGKSNHAEILAETSGNQVIYLATGKNTDEEMQKRIKVHKQRRPSNWITFEETLMISDTISEFAATSDIPITLLIESLDFWITNRLLDHPNSTYEEHETWLTSHITQLIQTCSQQIANTIIVTSEVGTSLVSEHQLGRWFQDLLGTINQIISASSDTVYYIVAGNVLNLKS